MARQLLTLAAGFFVGVFAALALGAVNYVLLSSRSDRAPEE
jgi:hypothetical protein